MRKNNMFLYLVSIVFAVFALAACETKEYSVDVINSSSKKVIYTYDGNRDILLSSSSRTYHVEANTPPPRDIIAENGVISVKLVIHSPGGKYEIINVPPITLHIINTLPVDVKIIATDYLEDNSANNDPIVLCQKRNPDGTPSQTIAYIYTDKPVFEFPLEYKDRQDYPYNSVIFDWEIKTIPETGDSSTQHMYLTLR
jgi:hypothetical protein